MMDRPQYPATTNVFERAAYAVLAFATGLGLLVVVSAAFTSQLTDAVAGRPAVVASR